MPSSLTEGFQTTLLVAAGLAAVAIFLVAVFADGTPPRSASHDLEPHGESSSTLSDPRVARRQELQTATMTAEPDQSV